MDSWRNYLQACTWLCLLTWEYLKNSLHPQEVLKKITSSTQNICLHGGLKPNPKFSPARFLCLCSFSLNLFFPENQRETPHKSHHLKSQMTQLLSEILHGFWVGLTHSSRTERELFPLEYLETSLAYSYSRVSEAYGFTSRSGRTRGVRGISSQASYVSSAFLSPLDST